MFPNPKQMLQSLVEDGRRLVTIIDPHVKVNDSYFLYEQAKERNLLVLNKD